ncbi:GNAT family N-acetyltransferase [Jatrophihabitans sp. DSM 45814]
MAETSGYQIDDDPRRVDVDAAWRFLSSEAYWARWRTRADVERQIAAAWRVVGCYDACGAMVGFARAVSDGCNLAYLADVYVHREHRGRGLGEALVRAMIDDGPGAEFRWMLHTADAHGLYRKFGFKEPDVSYLERPSQRADPSSAHEEHDRNDGAKPDHGDAKSVGR